METWLLTFSAVLSALLLWEVLGPITRRLLTTQGGHKALGFLSALALAGAGVGVVGYLVRKYALPGLETTDLVVVCGIVALVIALVDYANTERRRRRRTVR